MVNYLGLMLLNTSFNLHGFPIIKDLNQALNILIKSNLDGLLLENCLILKMKIKIKNRYIGNHYPTYFIADIEQIMMGAYKGKKIN